MNAPPRGPYRGLTSILGHWAWTQFVLPMTRGPGILDVEQGPVSFALPIRDTGEFFLVGSAHLHVSVDHAPTSQKIPFVNESLIQSQL